MAVHEAAYREIERLLPIQRGNVKISNRRILEALVYICTNGCKRRALPEAYGNWHVYPYGNQPAGEARRVPERVFAATGDARPAGRVTGAVSLDPAAVEVHAGGTGALKKTVRGRQAGAEPDGQQGSACRRETGREPVATGLSAGNAGGAAGCRKVSGLLSVLRRF